MDNEIKSNTDEYEQLRNMEIFGWYIKGARAMLRRIIEEFGEYLFKCREGVYNKALVDLIYTDVERFLIRDYDEIRFSKFERNKKGKLISAVAVYYGERVYNDRQ